MTDYKKLFLSATTGIKHEVDPSKIEPVENVVNKLNLTPEQYRKYFESGLNSIKAGEVAVVVMSGGQGTRLGSSSPKGMFDIGCGKSLFELQAEQLKTLSSWTNSVIPWYIMTSSATDQPIKDYFKNNNNLGYSEVNFFQQDDLPAFTLDGDFIPLENGISRSPNGNGGIFVALKKYGVIDQFKDRGIKYVFIYCVDNAIAKIADPLFIGLTKEEGYDCCNKVVSKLDRDEKVGCYCLNDGKPHVVEYSDMTDDLLDNQNLSTANIAIHCLTTEFLDNLDISSMEYHVARKKIKYYDGEKIVTPTEINGIKLELFIFDAFRESKNFGLFIVEREREFAPVKNAEGNDSPATALALLNKYKN